MGIAADQNLPFARVLVLVLARNFEHKHRFIEHENEFDASDTGDQ